MRSKYTESNIDSRIDSLISLYKSINEQLKIEGATNTLRILGKSINDSLLIRIIAIVVSILSAIEKTMIQLLMQLYSQSH